MNTKQPTSPAKKAMHRDWEQTKADFSKKSGQELNQNVSDTVKQAAGKEAIPPDYVANRKVDDNRTTQKFDAPVKADRKRS